MRSMSPGPQGVLELLRRRWARARRRGGLGLWRLLVELRESVTITPGQIVVGALGEILVVSQALGEVGDGLDTVDVGGRNQGHVAVPDVSAVLSLVGEGAGEIADRDDQGLLDEVGVEGHAGDLVELGEARPLVDDEADGLPQRRVGLDEVAVDLVLAHLPKPQHLRLRVLAVVKHPLVGAEAERLGLVIVVEDLLVYLCSHGVLGRKLVLDRSKLQLAVSIANRLFELLRVAVREVLRGRIGESDELVRTRSAMLEDPVDDLASVVPAGEEQHDPRLLSVDVDAGGVDPGPDVLGRLTQQRESLELLLDLSSRLDDHRDGIIVPEGRCVADRMPLERPVQGGQQVVALVDDAPLVGVGQGHTWPSSGPAEPRCAR
jgi:hypothetical protein